MAVIKTFRHKGIRQFFETGTTKGIQAAHGARLKVQLTALNAAKAPKDMGAPGWGLHPLKGELEGHWAVTVNGNWRLTFMFDGEDAILVDYQDYH
jgi:proteic killer suppression protein